MYFSPAWQFSLIPWILSRTIHKYAWLRVKPSAFLLLTMAKCTVCSIVSPGSKSWLAGCGWGLRGLIEGQGTTSILLLQVPLRTSNWYHCVPVYPGTTAYQQLVPMRTSTGTNTYLNWYQCVPESMTESMTFNQWRINDSPRWYQFAFGSWHQVLPPLRNCDPHLADA